MAISESSLAAKIKANIEAITNFPTPGTNPLIIDMRFINAVSKAIVDELTTNAVIIPNTFANPVGQAINVTTGPGSGSTGATTAPSPITGTGKIT